MGGQIEALVRHPGRGAAGLAQPAGQLRNIGDALRWPAELRQTGRPLPHQHDLAGVAGDRLALQREYREILRLEEDRVPRAHVRAG